MVSHNIYTGKSINGGFLRVKWPPILVCFVLLWGGGPLISIDLHILRVRARLFMYLTRSNQIPSSQLVQPDQSVECLSIVIENSTKKAPDNAGA